jgi:phage terminase large subunit-like protein
MPQSFKLTEKQEQARKIISSDATHIMLYGGSRSGKTFLFLYAIVIRALAAARSSHAVLRFRFNHVKASIVYDTLPRVMETCFPEVKYHLDKSDWFAQLPNGSQIWFGGLDDKERTEKVLGQEHASIFLNECSQIPWSSRNLAVTRLAQKVSYEVDGETRWLRLKMYYDENPPSKAHWTYRLFQEKRDPEGKWSLLNPEDYISFVMNPEDNRENLPEEYFKNLDSLPTRLRKRFRLGEFADVAEDALWTDEVIDRWRSLGGDLPDMQRIVISVDPSGSGDEDNASNDEIGITVGGLGTDGNGYLLEDLSIKAGPATWGGIATSAFDRHAADLIVGETNFGGEMVKFVVQTAKPRVPFKKLMASRGKVVRAEPISALTEQGKIRFAGVFPQLEEELGGFTTTGYKGNGSPNRADSFIWLMSELFPGIIREPRKGKNLPTRANSMYNPHRMRV